MPPNMAFTGEDKCRYTGLTGNHTYGYDQYGRISQINGIAYTRLANSELIAQISRPNGLNSVWSYENNRDLVTEVSDSTAATLGYVNNALGNRTAMSRAGSVFGTADTIAYAYNDRGEVTAAASDAAGSPYSYSYAYDPIGNRLTAALAGRNFSYTSNLLNQYTAVNTTVPTYDDDGNMLTNGNWTYTWSGENRLIRAENATTGIRIEADYDYMGRRIFKKVYQGNTLTKHLSFVYDGYKLIEEHDALNSDALLRRYVWQPESLGRDVPLTVYDAAADATYCYHTDANKNVTMLSDSTGSVVAHYEYSPFGVVENSNGNYAGENPFRFSSEYADEETGLVYYNYRHYDPVLGRWLSRDPIEEQGGYNLYGMIENDPLNGWDKLGKSKFHDWCKIIIFLVGLVGGDPSAGNSDPPPPPPPPPITTTVGGSNPKRKDDNPKIISDPLPWWARGGQTVDNIIDTTGVLSGYVAYGAAGTALVLAGGTAVIPILAPVVDKITPLLIYAH